MACSTESRAVPLELTLWRGSSISSISVAAVVGRPFALHQGFARLVRILGGADQLDDFVDIGDRNGETDQNMGAVARLAEQEFGAP